MFFVYTSRFGKKGVLVTYHARLIILQQRKTFAGKLQGSKEGTFSRSTCLKFPSKHSLRQYKIFHLFKKVYFSTSK